ncbi:MAG: hemerythrin domain-containing protein [Polyangiaceae bacterium]|nr:hemerythrin domain-containing protein [Polyangiaceae bacterium]
MKLLHTLREEHALIERVALSFATLIAECERGTVPPADADAFVRFFQTYVLRHHKREEDILFQALVRETDAPAERGPIRVLSDDHAGMAAQLNELRALLLPPKDAVVEAAKAKRLGGQYVRALIQHIDAENDVLIPESLARFKRANIKELPELWDESETPDLAAGQVFRLLERYEPAKLTDIFRGGRCSTCQAFGTRCDGVEREWSSEAEWEDMVDRIG